MKVANSIEGINFFHTFDEGIASEYKVETRPAIVLFKSFDEPRVNFDDKWSIEGLREFV